MAKHEEKSYTMLNVHIDYPLSALKRAYRQHVGTGAKVTKEDISVWVGNMVSADIQDIISNDKLEE